jgi:hypothetical protein
MPVEKAGISARVSLVPLDAPHVTPHRTVAAPTSVQVGEGPSPFARLLRGLAAEVERGESLTRAAMGAAGGGGHLAAGDLLALQAGVCRYSEALDLAARLVDRSAASVKAVLQGQ